MKTNKIILTFFLILFSFFFFSCEKEILTNEKKDITNSETNPYNYAFVNPQWLSIDDNFIDENGNVGSLYVNNNNVKEKMFIIKHFSKSNNSFQFTGKLQVELSSVIDKNGVMEWIPTYKCVKDTKKECRVTFEKNEKNELVSVLMERI